MKQTLNDSFNTYFSIRAEFDSISGWIGESTSSEVIQPLLVVFRRLSESIKTLCLKENIDWTIKYSLGHGRATPDHYISILPPDQVVSDGIYICFCFDRIGSGCVFGAMTSLLTKQIPDSMLVNRARVSSGGKKNPWILSPPNSIDVFEKNNAFINPIEILRSQCSKKSFNAEKVITNHLLESKKIIEPLLNNKNRIVRPRSVKTSSTDSNTRKYSPENSPSLSDSSVPQPLDCPRYLSQSSDVLIKEGTKVYHSKLGKGTIVSIGQYGIMYVLFDSGEGKNFFPRSFEDGSIRIDSSLD